MDERTLLFLYFVSTKKFKLSNVASNKKVIVIANLCLMKETNYDLIYSNLKYELIEFPITVPHCIVGHG